MKRWEAVAQLAPLFDDALVVVCNGMMGRDLFGVADKPGQFYMIGSMGLASSIGLGLALARPKRRVVVLDGDGNVFMNLGGLANVGAARPSNLYHVILDNGTHASTGDQKTISSTVRLEEVARSVGYRKVWRIREGLAKTAPEFFESEGPVCLLVEVEPGNQKKVPRVSVPPPRIASRFRQEATR